MREAATVLGNTLSVCWKYYMHYGVTDAYLEGTLKSLSRGFRPKRQARFRVDEQLLHHILQRLARKTRS